MSRAWLLMPALAAAFTLSWWGPDLGVRLGERGEVENLCRLGGAVALYMTDHDGGYPLLASVNSMPVSADGHPSRSMNPLSPYAKDWSWLHSTGTHLPYEMRFAQCLRTRNPRDPMSGVVTMRPLVPDPRQVVAAALYEDGWRRGWTQFSRPVTVGTPLTGHAYLLRGDRVETIDLARAKYAFFDGETGRWDEPRRAIESDWSGKPWSNPSWTVYPGELWPVRTVSTDDR